MNLIVVLVIGGIVGWLASIAMRTCARTMKVANVVLGVLGSFFAVFAASALGVRDHALPASWFVAVVGAAALIALLRALGVFDRVARAR